MQRFVISACAAALILVAFSWTPRPVSAASKGIVGTWELVSGEINGEPITGKHVKMISAHYFYVGHIRFEDHENAGCRVGDVHAERRLIR